jgi:hypothetical protein
LLCHALTSNLTISYSNPDIPGVPVNRNGTPFASQPSGCNGAAEKVMKIYLLVMLIGTLLAAIHFTSAPKQDSNSLPQ